MYAPKTLHPPKRILVYFWPNGKCDVTGVVMHIFSGLKDEEFSTLFIPVYALVYPVDVHINFDASAM
jgi:hypothetical protein